MLFYECWAATHPRNSEKFMEIFYFFYFTGCVVNLYLSPRHGVSSLSGWRNCLQTWRVAGNVLNKQSGQKWNGGPTALCLGELVTNFHFKSYNVTKYLKLFVVGCCECGNGHRDSVKCEEFLHYFWNCWFIRSVFIQGLVQLIYRSKFWGLWFLY